MRVFLDANVLFSAADHSSATRQLLQIARSQAELVTNDHAAEEARRNIAAKRPTLAVLLEELVKQITITRAFEIVEAELPEDDKPILAGAVGARCTHLWTGDKRHFGSFYGKSVHGVKIVSAIQLLNDLEYG